MELLTLLSVVVLVCSLVVPNRASPLQQPDVARGVDPTPVPSTTETRGFVENADDEDDLLGEPDFEDDDVDDSFLDLTDSKELNVNSLMHIHQKGGEVLVPCFGMWWPVGGSAPPVYEYVEDYYGDYKKRRRSRKRKKAAKAKRKKS